MTVKSTFHRNLVLSNALTGGATPHISLHTANPGIGPENTAEVVPGGNAYVRKLAAFTAPAAGSTSNSAEIVWENMPAVTITHIAVWDALAGNKIYAIPVTTPKTSNAGDTIRILVGELTITES